MSVDQTTQAPSQLVVAARLASDTIEALLLSVGRGNQDAFVALQSRMTGLVQVNIRRVLRDATRSETVTRQTFDDIRKDAIHFDPQQNSAESWLLTCAHKHAIDGLDPAVPTNKEHP